MDRLLEIEGFDEAMAELFEAAGFVEETSVFAVSKEELFSELSKANEMLQIVENLPTMEALASWQELLSDGKVEIEPEVQDSPVITPQSAARELKPVPRALSVAVAIPLSDGFVEEHALDLSVLPAAEVVDDTVLELRKHISARDQHLFRSSTTPPKESEAVVTATEKRKLDIERVKTLEEFREEGGHVEPLERSSELDLTKTPKAGNNLGLSPTSRRYLRGVLHKEPVRTVFGSVAFILVQILLVLAIAPIIYILSSPDDYIWGLLSPLLLVIAGVIYVAFARQVGCPVCRQRQYVPKECRKHMKAHTLPFLGHMLPTALHIILFKWFHCIFCGTSIRVKE